MEKRRHIKPEKTPRRTTGGRAQRRRSRSLHPTWLAKCSAADSAGRDRIPNSAEHQPRADLKRQRSVAFPHARTHVEEVAGARHSIAPSGRLTGAGINAPSGLPLSIRADSHYLYLSSLPFAVLATAVAVAVIALRSAVAVRAIRRWRRKSERLIVAALSPQVTAANLPAEFRNFLRPSISRCSLSFTASDLLFR